MCYLSDAALNKLHHLTYRLYKKEDKESISMAHDRKTAVEEVDKFLKSLSDDTVRNIHIMTVLLYGLELENLSKKTN